MMRGGSSKGSWLGSVVRNSQLETPSQLAARNTHLGSYDAQAESGVGVILVCGQTEPVLSLGHVLSAAVETKVELERVGDGSRSARASMARGLYVACIMKHKTSPSTQPYPSPRRKSYQAYHVRHPRPRPTSSYD